MTIQPSYEDLLHRISELEEETRKSKQAAEILRESEKRYQSLLEQAGDGIFILDTNLKLRSVNASFAKMHGFSVEEILSMGLDHLDVQGTIPRPDRHRRIMAGETLTFEVEHYHKDGHTFPLSVTANLVTAGDEALIIAVHRDLTRRKQTEAALQESEKKYRALASTVDSLTVVDRDGRHLFMNDAYLKRLGMDEGSVIGRKHSELHNEEAAAAFMEGVKYVFDTGKVGHDERRGHRSGIWWFRTFSPVMSIDGSVEAVIVAFKDITERKRAEEKLQNSEKRYRELVERTGCLITNVDDKGCFTYVNELGEKILGKKQDALIGLPAFRFVHPDDQAETEAWFRECINNHLSQSSIENRQINVSTGAISHMLWTSHFTYDETGKIKEASGIAQDITDRKKFQETVGKIEKLEAIGTLASGIAHDFNNLHGAMFGYLELSQITAENNHQLELASYLGKARKCFDRATELTGQLLTFTKGGTPYRKTQSLSEHVRQTLSVSLQGTSVKPQFIIPDDIWLSDFDAQQITQVLDNMLFNARHAMPHGGVVDVSLKNIPAADAPDVLPSKNYICISIHDHGTGIEQKHLAHIFDPFYSTKNMGDGLGLATSFSIIRQHDGFIDVDSVLGQGTTFYIYLPASSGAVADIADEQPLRASAKGRILIMDDEEMILDMLALMLENMGYEVVKTRHGKEAKKTMQEAVKSDVRFTAAILDLTIPHGLGGKDIVYPLLALHPGIKVIASSGSANDPVMSNPEDYGFAGRLVKPYRRSDLILTLGSALSESI